MADIKVKDLTDTTSIELDNQVMVLTNDAQNQVQNITVGNLLTNVLSSDNGNVLEQGTDGKLYVETPENITGELSDLSTTEKSSLVGAINEVNSDLATEVINRTNAVSGEATIRANADNNLQTQIDAITAASDVTDIVGTYAQLQAYDTTGLADNSIIKVLQDESRQDETTYYRWVITGGVGAWVLIGEEGPYYTISQADSKFATQETVGNLNNLATSDKSSIVNAMNELASVLDPTQTADYIKNSKAIYSGEVSENALILPQIKEMVHSTFDRSKFTVVGSPNITDDGIASGFSGSNYVNMIQLSELANKSWKITSAFYYTQKSSSQEIMGLSSTYVAYGGVRCMPNNDVVFLAKFGTSSESSVDGNKIILSNVLTTSRWYFTELSFNIISGEYTLSLFDNIGNLINSDTYTPTTTNKQLYDINENPTTYITLNPLSGIGGIMDKYDLKQFSITVDGVEVFSGNKTGIDTIKPDDYTVVGTPTITSDGIASGFSTNNYLVKNNLSLNGNNIVINGYADLTNVGSDSYAIFNLTTSNDRDFVLRKYTNNQLSIIDSISYTSVLFNINPFNLGVLKFYYELSINTIIATCTITIKDFITGTTYTDTKSLDSNIISALSSVNKIHLGKSYGGWQAWFDNTTIDLNAFKIYVDGNLVYQPCLKIPYTEAGNGKGYNASTGSKIVQSIYRDRVSDMYEQFGYAPYYTLSDTDFTLPQGEIYGYLEKRARDIAHPVAQPFYRFSDEINEDEVRLEGAEVDKGLYLAIEQDPYLSALCTAGSTADKICLPDFRNRVIYGDVASGYVEPELPNITGNISVQWGFDYSAVGDGGSGALYNNYSAQSQNGIVYNADTTNSADSNIRLDASRSSSIYKDGGTVKTAGVKARWLCRWK